MLSYPLHERKTNPTYAFFLFFLDAVSYFPFSIFSFIVVPTVEENGLFLSLQFYSLWKLAALSSANKDIYQAE